MAKFKYKFRAIKQIKERLEKKAQKDLSIIDIDIADKKNEILDLLTKLKELKIKKIETKNKKVTELHFYEKYESFIKEQIRIIENYLVQKMIERNEKLEELMKKSMETKTFEKLEETHLEDFVKSQNKLEQKEMDEFAVNEFIRE